MKVLQINAIYGSGSTGNITKEIHELCLNKGIESYVAYSSTVMKTDEIINGYKIGNPQDKKLHALFGRVTGLQGYYSKKVTKDFLKHLDKIQPDIIHLHNLHSNFINIIDLFKYTKTKKIKTVITLHDCWLFTGKCSHFLYDNCNKWISGCHTCPRLKKDIPSFFFDRTPKMYNDKKLMIGENPYVYLIGCSDWMTKTAKQSILKDRHAETIYNGIDLNIFKPTDSDIRKQLNIESKFIVLGFANKWLSKDNTETFNYIKSNLSDDSVMLLVGCFDEQIANLPKNVVGIPFIRDAHKLAEYYSAADIFVNVTKADTLPTVNMEAQACGTPVITYNSGGSAELVTEKTGAVVEYADASSLLKEINIVKSNGKAHYIEACINHAKENFEKAECFLKYIDFYKRLLEKEE